MMNAKYEEFKKLFIEELQRTMGESVRIIEGECLKNNDIKVDTISCKEEGMNLTPRIRTKEFYNIYQQFGLQTAVSVAEEILGVRSKVDAHEYKGTWETVKSKVFVEVVNYEWNKERLEKDEIVYEKLLDLALIFKVSLGEDKELGMIITSGLMKEWEITKEELINVAFENFARTDYKITPMEELLREYLEEEMESNLYVLSNVNRCRGASGIFRADLLQYMADKKDCDLLILPSSVDEVLVLAWNSDAPELSELRIMVKDINGACVSEEERLSDNVYIFRKDTGKIEIAKDEDEEL